MLADFGFANLIGTNFNQRDLQILKEMDIPASYITDYKLQRTYSKFLKYRKTKFIEHLNEASLFLPKIKDILKKEGIPSPFLFLVMAESNYSLDAKSNMKAIGLWQFMSGTAKRYGLKKNMYVDERFDIVKSTKAASKYLKYLHGEFGKWYLAAIAYNCGEGRLIEAMARASVDIYAREHGVTMTVLRDRKIIRDYQSKRTSYYHLLRTYRKIQKWGIDPSINTLLTVQTKFRRQYLPSESREYIRKIVSYALMSNRNFILDDSHLLNIGTSASIATIKVKGGTLIRSIAKCSGLSYKQLRELNRQLKQAIISPHVKSYDVYIPYPNLVTYNMNKENLDNTRYLIHRVASGDTLEKIGKRYGVNYAIIKDFNGLKNNMLTLNEKILIPIALHQRMPRANADYVIKSGDTLEKIAHSHSMDIATLMHDNNLKTTFIKIGDKIVIKGR